MAPCAITVMSSAISNTTSMSCSMMMMSIVRASSRIFATARSVSAGLMPQVGSSSSSSRGSEISAMPISSSATSPYDSVPACRRASADRPICSSVRSTVSRVPPVARRGTERMQEAAPAWPVIQRFSATRELRKDALDLQGALDAEPADLVRLQGR